MHVAGCAKDAGRPASAANVTLSPQQELEARHILAEAVAPVEAPPLDLLPASGVRWPDVRRAVETIQMPKQSDGSMTLVAVVTSHIDQDRAILELVTADGWPAVITATRRGDEVHFDATMGPYPTDPRAIEASRELEAAAMESLEAWGRKPELPAEPLSR